jgi:hypothetical protein
LKTFGKVPEHCIEGASHPCSDLTIQSVKLTIMLRDMRTDRDLRNKIMCSTAIEKTSQKGVSLKLPELWSLRCVASTTSIVSCGNCCVSIIQKCPENWTRKAFNKGIPLPAFQVSHYPSVNYVAHQGKAAEGDPNAIALCTPKCPRPSSGWLPPIDQGREVLLQQ